MENLKQKTNENQVVKLTYEDVIQEVIKADDPSSIAEKLNYIINRYLAFDKERSDDDAEDAIFVNLVLTNALNKMEHFNKRRNGVIV